MTNSRARKKAQRPRYRPRTVKALFGLSCMCLLGIACASRVYIDRSSERLYETPQQTGDGWETASLADVGMDAGPVTDLLGQLHARNDHQVHAIVVARQGKLVFEEYFAGEHVDLSNMREGTSFSYTDFERDTPHILASATKSVTSILLGIAKDKGLIQSMDETLFSFFPEYSYLADPMKGEITVAQMLTMTSGLSWDEGFPYDDARNDWLAMIRDQDPVAYALGKLAFASPGSRFRYNSGTTNLLGEIVRRRSDMALSDFAEQHLFTPLGISTYEWYGFPNAPEMAVASTALYLRPRDMAKIGQMCLDGGVWNGTRVVSRSWVEKSASGTVDLPDSENPIPGYLHSYGMQWWLGTFSTRNTEFFLAAGFGGQFIIVMPGADMVVVVTAGDFADSDYGAILGMVDDHVLPALSN